MRPIRHLLLFITLALWTDAVQALDLNKIDRTIRKEPAYESKAPMYCLLVFGPEAKTRVWLVLDGAKLYVDRNGDGDLTEAGKRVSTKLEKDGSCLFEAGDVRDGALMHTGLQVGVGALGALAETLRDLPDYKRLIGDNLHAKCYTVTLQVSMPGRRGAGADGRVEHMVWLFDSHGLLQFSARPQDAPIIHFGGPWSMTTYGKQTLRLGEVNDLVVGFGTPGLGAGTFAYAVYEQLAPEGVAPVVDIDFPTKMSGSETLKAHNILDRRC